MTRKSSKQEARTEELQTALAGLEIARKKNLKIMALRIEQAANMPRMCDLLDPALDELEFALTAIKYAADTFRRELDR